MFKDIANLIYVTTTQDQDGFNVETEVKNEAYVNVKSVKYGIKFAAMAIGKTPTIVFELRCEDWEATRHIVNNKAIFATRIEYDGATYEIITDYSDDNSMVTLTCG